MSIDMNQFHDVFFEESQEHLDEMERLLIDFDIASPQTEDLHSIFRAAHSIKGGSGIFGFDALTDLTHLMESLLDKARKGQFALTREAVDGLLSTKDILQSILDSYKAGEEVDRESIKTGSALLQSFLDGAGDVNKDKATAQAVTEEEQGFGFFEPLPELEEISSESEKEEPGFGFFEPLEPSELEQGTPQNSAPLAEAQSDPQEVIEKNTPPLEADTKPLSQNKVAKAKSTPATESTSIRVDTGKVDALVNLVGELVIAQSMIKMASEDEYGNVPEKLEEAIDMLSRNVREVQEISMSMRMLPMSYAFNRFPRVVRDLATKLDKKVELVIEGGNTEIDKGVIEKLVDPLTHLVRNSIDHGVELSAERLAAGKTETGQITLKAEQRGGSIVIRVIDDGAGLNRDKILARARQNGIPINDSMTDSQIWNLIFSPGFSTAEAVTDVSGRGVGMDVVQRNIESIGGHVEILSEANKGSSFNIRLPLTLAILDGMCVSAGDQIFIVPLINITESIQPEAAQLKKLANEQLLRSRGAYWPIISLKDCMNIVGGESDPTQAIVMLIETSTRRFGLLVDGLVGQQQVVIKSLEQHYKRVPGAAGATIMGDGSVALILDLESIANNVPDIPLESEVKIA